MELSVSGRQRRAVQTAKAAPQTEKQPQAAGKSAPRKTRTDKLSWSRQALSFLEELNRQDLEKQRKLLEAKQKGNGELDAMREALKKMERCQKIASRIMKGDKVPPQDERYLMECDPDGYKLALACRKPKEHPKEWESVLKEDEEKRSDAQTAEAADSGGEAEECG